MRDRSIPARARGIRRRAGLLVVAVLTMLVAAACRADVDVTIQVADDGSGMVTTEVLLDAETTEGLADLDDGATLLLNDLAVAGWDVIPPLTDDNGETRIVATKVFGTPEQLSAVMNDLTGPDGVFQDFRLVRTQTFGRVDYQVNGIVDPTDSFDSFGDEGLVTALGPSLLAIAVSPPYEAAEEDVTFTVNVEMPGEFQEEGSNGSISPVDTAATGTRGTRGTWSTDLAASQRLELSLATARRSTTAQVLRGVAVVAAVLAALVLFAQILRVFGGRRRRFQEERARAARQAQAKARRAAATVGAGGGTGPSGPGGSGAAAGDGRDDEAGRESAEARQPGEGYRVVALDGPGVLYREGDDIRRLLVPFARERGSTVPPQDIVDKARLMSLGRITSADFWQAIGVEGDPNELDNAYLANHQLNPGVVRYLRSLRDQGIRVACITNDSAAWAMKLRLGHSLGGLIDPWVVSGSVGVRKPDQPLFEVLRRVTGEPTAAILVIDDNLDNLDAARDLGFGTRWFTRDGDRASSRGHEVMRGFEAFNPVDTSDVVVESRPDET